MNKRTKIYSKNSSSKATKSENWDFQYLPCVTVTHFTNLKVKYVRNYDSYWRLIACLLAFGKYIVEPTFQALSDLFKVVSGEVVRVNPETVISKPSKNAQVIEDNQSWFCMIYFKVRRSSLAEVNEDKNRLRRRGSSTDRENSFRQRGLTLYSLYR